MGRCETLLIVRPLDKDTQPFSLCRLIYTGLAHRRFACPPVLFTLLPRLRMSSHGCIQRRQYLADHPRRTAHRIEQRARTEMMQRELQVWAEPMRCGPSGTVGISPRWARL